MGRLDKMEGLQRINVRQKCDEETGGEGLQNRGQASDVRPIWIWNGYNEATGKTETVKRDEDAT